MIAYWPGTIEPGRVTDHLSAFWDISPTVRELTGAEVQADTDGISMVPTLLEKVCKRSTRIFIGNFMSKGGKRAIRPGQMEAYLLPDKYR